MKTKNADTLMVHAVSANVINNAAKFSHNSICGHYHSSFGIAYHADKAKLRWAMIPGAMLDPNSPAARYGSGAILKRPILGCGILLGQNGCTLVMPDMHLPYHHRDSFSFLKAVADLYECDKVINTGDLIDWHRGSYHESEVDALNEEDEYFMSKKYAQELQSMFPEMVITLGNHDRIPTRKLKSIGLPTSLLSDCNTLYGTKPTWEWVNEYWFDSKGASPILIPMTLTNKGRWNKKV